MAITAKGETIRRSALKFLQVELSKNNNFGFGCGTRAAQFFDLLFFTFMVNILGGALEYIMYKELKSVLFLYITTSHFLAMEIRQ